MALKLEITNKKGVTTMYHRIYSVLVDKSITVNVRSYTNESYRFIEKERDKNVDLLISLDKKIREYINKPEYTQQMIELSKQHNELTANGITMNPVQESYSLIENTYNFVLDKEDVISFENLYKQLKTLDEFKNALDI